MGRNYFVRRLHYAAGEVRSYTFYFPLHRRLWAHRSGSAWCLTELSRGNPPDVLKPNLNHYKTSQNIIQSLKHKRTKLRAPSRRTRSRGIAPPTPLPRRVPPQPELTIVISQEMLAACKTLGMPSKARDRLLVGQASQWPARLRAIFAVQRCSCMLSALGSAE